MKASDHFVTLDATRIFVETMTGIKAQFIEIGWTPENAERAALAMIQGAANGARP